MDSRFEDIRPYNDREAQFVLSNLFEDKGFQKALNLIANRYPMEQMKEEFTMPVLMQPTLSVRFMATL